MASRVPPPQKFRGQHMAPGSWDPDLRRRGRHMQRAARQRTMQLERLIRSGRPASLWLPVALLTPGAVACTCVKATGGNAERRCVQCYSSAFIPGYLKFLHETLFWSAAESSAFTLTGVVLDTETKPHTLRLAAGALTGTIVTQAKAFANSAEALWSFHAEWALHSTGDDVTAEFSTNNGVTWRDIADLNDPAFLPAGVGTLRVRITLTRADVDLEGPSFDIFRMRHPRPDAVDPYIALTVDDYSRLDPGILLARVPPNVQAALDARLGKQVETVGDRGWTLPLDAFDITLEAGDPATRIDINGVEPPPIYQPLGPSVFPARRFTMAQFAYSDELANGAAGVVPPDLGSHTLISQTFQTRQVQPNEFAHLVF